MLSASVSLANGARRKLSSSTPVEGLWGALQTPPIIRAQTPGYDATIPPALGRPMALSQSNKRDLTNFLGCIESEADCYVDSSFNTIALEVQGI